MREPYSSAGLKLVGRVITGFSGEAGIFNPSRRGSPGRCIHLPTTVLVAIRVFVGVCLPL